MAGVLFEDIFNVKDIDPEGKKFDRGESDDFLSNYYFNFHHYKFSMDKCGIFSIIVHTDFTSLDKLLLNLSFSC